VLPGVLSMIRDPAHQEWCERRESEEPTPVSKLDPSVKRSTRQSMEIFIGAGNAASVGKLDQAHACKGESHTKTAPQNAKQNPFSHKIAAQAA